MRRRLVGLGGWRCGDPLIDGPDLISGHGEVRCVGGMRAEAHSCVAGTTGPAAMAVVSQWRAMRAVSWHHATVETAGTTPCVRMNGDIE